jgi:Tol biopolymer transport system component
MRTWCRRAVVVAAVLAALTAALAANAGAAVQPRSHTTRPGPARHRTPARHPVAKCHSVRRGRHIVKVCSKPKPKPKRKPKPRVKPTSHTPSPPPAGAGSGGSPGTAPATGKVVFDYAGNLYEVTGLGQGRTQLTQGGSPSPGVQYIEPSLSRDGTRLVFQGPDEQAYTADGNGQNMHALTNGSMPTMLPRISPDGSQVMWVTTFLMEYGAEIANTIESYDGSGAAQNYSQTIGMAGFAPGGEYVCNNGAVNTITIATAAQIAANQCSQVVANDVADPNARFGVRPAFSPDGSLVVDSISEDGGNTTTGLYLYDVATGQLLRQLTTGNDDMPVFSPDGSEILFNRGSDIYEVPTAGGSATLFQADGSDPAWSN